MRSFEKRGARVEVWRDLYELSARAAELFREVASERIAAEGDFTVALSGGSTPKALYARLATEAAREHALWSRTQVFWSDERCVPPDDPQSNYRMAHETLLAHVPVPSQQIHRMRGEDEPQSAAAAYTSVLAEHLAARDYRFGLILLGMGDDGHTASLFPHSDTLSDTDHLVAAPYVAKLGVHRLTLTLSVINRATNIIFLVSGESKAAALAAVLEGESDLHLWPAWMVHPERDGKLIWLVDEGAAKLLSL